MTELDKRRQLEQLLQAINHDLRTPLSNIRSSTAILLQNLSDPLTEDQRVFMDFIDHSTTRLLDQSNRLMLFGQILFTSEIPEMVQLSELLANVTRTLKNTYGIDSATLVTDGDPLLNVSLHAFSSTLALLAAGDTKNRLETIPEALPAVYVRPLPEQLCFTIHSLMPADDFASSLVEVARQIVQQHGGSLEVGEASGQKQFSFCVPFPSSPT